MAPTALLARMSRTTLCLVTAVALAGVSLAVMAARRQALGDEVKLPQGPGTWKVTLVVRGQMKGDARLTTLTPPTFGRQQVLREVCRSEQLINRPPEARHPERGQVLWSRRAGAADGPFRLHCEFVCQVDGRAAGNGPLDRALYAAPRPGEHLAPEAGPAEENARVSDVARQVTAGLEAPLDQAEALFRFIDEEIANEPRDGDVPRPAECLEARAGDSLAQSRLLAAMLRSRGISARLVTGLWLTGEPEQTAQTWVEAWVGDHWRPMSPFHGHFGRLPTSYLVLGFGERAVARGKNVTGLRHAFLVEQQQAAPPGAVGTAAQRAFRAISLYRLPPPEQRLVEFLLLVPVAALIICVFRNVIGLPSFGTFAPALLGLAFREWHSLPGLLVFVAVVLIGWLMRRVLNQYHLLQVPRAAFQLSLVVLTLLAAIVGANMLGLPATRYVAIFPIVILTGMIERFWTLETEDGTASSFRVLANTLVIAATVALVLSLKSLAGFLLRFPETIGLIMAAQLVLGRYTGYRLSELFRFRELIGGAETGLGMGS